MLFWTMLGSKLSEVLRFGSVAAEDGAVVRRTSKQDNVYLFVDKESVQDATWLAEEFDEDEEMVVLEVKGVRRRYENHYEIKARNINPQRLKVTDIQF